MAPELDDATLVSLATHDFLTAMQRLFGELELVEPSVLPAECATNCCVTWNALGDLESLVKQYCAGRLAHAEFGSKLLDAVERVASATATLIEQMHSQPEVVEHRRQLSNATTGLKAAGLASANLVLGLATWSREPGKSQNLSSLLQALAETHSARANDKEIELVVELGHAGAAPCVPEWVVATVVGNFLSNAIKYTDRGRIVLSSAPLRDHGVEVSVTDTGIGMEAETLRELTKPRVRARQVVAEGREGQGLGLTLAEWAARAVGAKLLFSSEVGTGTRASLLIPA